MTTKQRKKKKEPVQITLAAARIKEAELENLTTELVKSYFNFYRTRGFSYEKLSQMSLDPIINIGLTIVKSPIINSNWTIECEDNEIKDFITTALSQSWREFCIKSLRALDYGFVALELVYDVNQDNRLYVRKFNEAEPAQTTILYNPQTFSFSGFRYISPSGSVDIPPEKAFVWTWNEQYRNPYGTPYLAPVYKIWQEKQIISLYILRHFEKWGSPNIVIKYPPAPVFDNGVFITDENRSIAEQIGEQIKSNSVIAIPNEFTPDGKATWDITPFLTATESKSTQYLDYIFYIDKLILKGLLIPDQIAAEGKYGTYSLLKERANILADNIAYIREQFAKQIDKYYIRKLLAVNNYPDNIPCRIIFEPFHEEDKEFWKDLTKILTSAGYLTQSQVNEIFERVGLPLQTQQEQSVSSTSQGSMITLASRVTPPIERHAVNIRNDKIMDTIKDKMLKQVYIPLYRSLLNRSKQAKTWNELTEYELNERQFNLLKNAHSNFLNSMFCLGAADVYRRASSIIAKRRKQGKQLAANNPENEQIVGINEIAVEDWIDMPSVAVQEFWQSLVPISRDRFRELLRRGEGYGFMVAGYEDEYIINCWKEAVGRAIAEGKSIQEFAEDINSILRSAGLSPDNPFHIETVLRTNLHTAYMAGDYVALTEDNFVKEMFPLWQFIAVMDDRTTEICASLHGTIAPADDPFWDEHYPPLHYNCRSLVIPLDKYEIEDNDIGITENIEDLRNIKPHPDFANNVGKMWKEGNLKIGG